MGLQNVQLLSLVKFLKSTGTERCGSVLFSLCRSLSFSPFQHLLLCSVEWGVGGRAAAAITPKIRLFKSIFLFVGDREESESW